MLVAGPADDARDDANDDEDQRTWRLESLDDDDARPAELWPCAAPIGAQLGGSMRAGALVIIHGPSFSGKTSEACAVAVELGRKLLYVDAENQGPADVRARLAAAGASSRFIKKSPMVRDVSWEEAREAVEEVGAEVVIFDSLSRLVAEHEFASTLLEMRALAASSGALLLVVAHENERGRVRGGQGPVYDGDAVIGVHGGPANRDGGAWIVRKCRWNPGACGTRPRPFSDAGDVGAAEASARAVLSLAADANAAAVKRAVRGAMVEAHPDKFDTAPPWLKAAASARMLEIVRARRVLKLDD